MSDAIAQRLMFKKGSAGTRGCVFLFCRATHRVKFLPLLPSFLLLSNLAEETAEGAVNGDAKRRYKRESRVQGGKMKKKNLLEHAWLSGEAQQGLQKEARNVNP